jgi:hypothetical protein
MPYKLRKSRGKELYFVINETTKKKYSKDPLPLATAEAQMRALYRAEGLEFNKKERDRSKVLRRKLPQRSRFEPGSDKAHERMEHARQHRRYNFKEE